MKKVFFIISIVLLGTTISNAQIRWGVKAGGNLSSLTIKAGDESMKGGKSIFGFHLGGVMEYSINESMAIQPELQFIQNGGKFETSDISDFEDIIGEELPEGFAGKITQTIRVSQIQLPINFKYTFDLGEHKLFALVGPYLGYGISGKHKAKVTASFEGESASEESESIDIYKDLAKRFDLGLGLGIGMAFNNKYTVSIGYQLGLANLGKQDKTTIKSNNLMFSVGYFF